MRIASNIKWQTVHNGRSQTTKSSSNQNARRKKETYKYWGMVEVDIIKQQEKKKNIKKERFGKLLKAKIYSSNLAKWINTWAVPFIKYAGTFLKKTRE